MIRSYTKWAACFLVLSTVLLACTGEQTSRWTGPSGRSYEIVGQGWFSSTSGERALTLKYRVVDMSDRTVLREAADEFAGALKGQAENGNYNTMVIMAEKVNFKLGPFFVKKNYNTVYKRQPDGSWTAVN
ncbi:MAG: hypothetical protein ACE5IQ_06445 [Candidatus Methylomirabilales bacterium]